MTNLETTAPRRPVVHVDNNDILCTAWKRESDRTSNPLEKGRILNTNGRSPQEIAKELRAMGAIGIVLDYALDVHDALEVVAALKEQGQEIITRQKLLEENLNPNGCVVKILSSSIPHSKINEVIKALRVGEVTAIHLVEKPIDNGILKIYEGMNRIIRALENGEHFPPEIIADLRSKTRESLEKMLASNNREPNREPLVHFDDIWNGKPNHPQDPIIALTNQMLPHALSPNTLQGNQTTQGSWLARLKKKLGISR